MAKRCYIAVEGSADSETRAELLTLIAETFGAEVTDDAFAADIVLTDHQNLAREPFDRQKAVFVFELEPRGKFVDRDDSGPIKPRALLQFSRGYAYVWPADKKAAGTNGAAAAESAASKAKT